MTRREHLSLVKSFLNIAHFAFFMFASIAGVSSSSSLTILPKYLNVFTLLISSPPTLKVTLLDCCSSRCLRYRWYLGVSVLHSFVLRCFYSTLHVYVMLFGESYLVSSRERAWNLHNLFRSCNDLCFCQGKLWCGFRCCPLKTNIRCHIMDLNCSTPDNSSDILFNSFDKIWVHL